MSVTPPGQPPALHATLSANAQLIWNGMLATLSAKNNTSKAHHLQDMATLAGVPVSQVPALLAEIQAAAPEHVRPALREDRNGRVPAVFLAPSNL